jgi:exodeoxyribonuclease VII large subunit
LSDDSNIAEYSVSEISGAIKRTMEDTFGYVRVRGELGRISRPASGHIYLDLKDAQSVLSGVIWRGQASRLKIQPEQGLEVIATGKITTFPGQSKYQMVIDSIEPAGIGALMALLEERRKKLAAEGLFADARKRPLPYLPRVIGVVTSPTGAVIRDILHRISDRFPLHVLVWPVRVQGETSAREVANGIEGFNALQPGGAIPRPDLIIVARGGGSIEDLWGFNEEVVVRAAAASRIPLVSAVGHETDWTLIDHAADLRAPTPTGAAEIAVPVRGELIASLDDLARRTISGLFRLIAGRRTELRAASAALPSPRDLLALPRQRLDTYGERLAPALRAGLRDKRGRCDAASARLSPHALSRGVSLGRERLAGLEARARRAHLQRLATERARLSSTVKLLESLSYKNVLGRGYALVRGGDGEPLRSATGVATGAALSIEFGDETRLAAVAGGDGGPTPPASQSAAPRPRKSGKTAKAASKGQGSLF